MVVAFDPKLNPNPKPDCIFMCAACRQLMILLNASCGKQFGFGQGDFKKQLAQTNVQAEGFGQDGAWGEEGLSHYSAQPVCHSKQAKPSQRSRQGLEVDFDRFASEYVPRLNAADHRGLDESILWTAFQSDIKVQSIP